MVFSIGAFATTSSAQTTAPAASGKPPVTIWEQRPPVGETGETPGQAKVDTARLSEPAAGARRPNREFVLAPIPMINPTLENGLAIVGGVLYHVGDHDPRLPPSATFVTGFRTSNDSWSTGAIQSLHLDRDRYRITAAGTYMDVNFNFFGIGHAAGDASVSIPINRSGAGGIAEGLVRIRGNWYGGARYRLMRTTVSADLTDAPVPIPPRDIRTRTAALGPHIEYDTRNNPFYPTAGLLVDLQAGFAGEGIGGQRSYQQYLASWATYRALSPRQVLAARVNSCFADGDVPFYDMCLVGQYQDLRGYETGQYRDRSLLTGQAEYRTEVWWRVGLAAFVGVGEVASAFDDFTWDNVLPSAGAGLRFTLAKRNHVNLRVDYAWGKKSNALYISVGEAF